MINLNEEIFVKYVHQLIDEEINFINSCFFTQKKLYSDLLNYLQTVSLEISSSTCDKLKNAYKMLDKLLRHINSFEKLLEILEDMRNSVSFKDNKITRDIKEYNELADSAVKKINLETFEIQYFIQSELVTWPNVPVCETTPVFIDPTMQQTSVKPNHINHTPAKPSTPNIAIEPEHPEIAEKQTKMKAKLVFAENSEPVKPARNSGIIEDIYQARTTEVTEKLDNAVLPSTAEDTNSISKTATTKTVVTETTPVGNITETIATPKINQIEETEVESIEVQIVENEPIETTLEAPEIESESTESPAEMANDYDTAELINILEVSDSTKTTTVPEKPIIPFPSSRVKIPAGISFKTCKFTEKTLIISELTKTVKLPYTISELKSILREKKNKYVSLWEIVKKVYTKPLSDYKNSSSVRFKEGYNLIRKKEKGSRNEAFALGFELLSNSSLHPAVIAACKDSNELDVYLSCLEYNELQDFPFFKIVFHSTPTVSKASIVKKTATKRKKIAKKKAQEA